MTKAIMKCNKNGRRRRIGLTYADLHFKKSFLQPFAPQAHCLLIVQLFFHYSVDKMGVGLIETELALLYFKIHSWNIFFLSSPSRLFVQVQ